MSDPIQGETAPLFDVAPLDIFDPEFPRIAADYGLILADELPDPEPGEGRVRDVYLNDPELQKIYPLGLLPFGQLHFLNWLSTHGRRDQALTDVEIRQFLRASAADELRGLWLTYLLQPGWQRHFPDAFTAEGWKKFRRWIEANYGQHLRE